MTPLALDSSSGPDASVKLLQTGRFELLCCSKLASCIGFQRLFHTCHVHVSVHKDSAVQFVCEPDECQTTASDVMFCGFDDLACEAFSRQLVRGIIPSICETSARRLLQVQPPRMP